MRLSEGNVHWITIFYKNRDKLNEFIQTRIVLKEQLNKKVRFITESSEHSLIKLIKYKITDNN